MQPKEERKFYDYYFTGKTRDFCGVTLRQIARCGDHLIGGYIEKPENLIIQQVGHPAWVGENAIVYGSAVVDCAAVVDGHAIVCGNSHITYGAHVTNCARVQDSVICGMSKVGGEALVINSTVEDSILESSAKVKNAKLKFCKLKGCASDVVSGDYYNRIYNGYYWL